MAVKEGRGRSIWVSDVVQVLEEWIEYKRRTDHGYAIRHEEKSPISSEIESSEIESNLASVHTVSY